MALAALSAPVLGRLRSAEIYAILGFYSQVWVLAWGLLGILRPFARTFAGALLVAFLVALPVSAMTFWVVERVHATAGEGLGWVGIFRAGGQLAALVTLPLGFMFWRGQQAAHASRSRPSGRGIVARQRVALPL